MATIVVKGDDFDAYAATESYANDYVFHRWCEHLFLLNEELIKQDVPNAYYLRAYITTLYELSNEGLDYAEEQISQSIQDARYKLLVEMVADILSQLTNDEYFLLKYFRDSYCHIFTKGYNYYDKDGNLRTKSIKLYGKDRQKYDMTAREFMEKAESILGRNPSGELEFKKRLIQVCHPIISEYKKKFEDAEMALHIPSHEVMKILCGDISPECE